MTGHYSGPIDGIWSPEVEEALKALQTELGVEPTGVIDAETLRAFEAALIAAGNPPPTTTTTAAEAAPTTVPPWRTTTTTAAPAVTTTAPAATTTTVAPEPPPTVPVVEDGVLEVLAASGEFTQLLAAIDAAGLTEMLSGPGPFTLLLPPTRP